MIQNEKTRIWVNRGLAFVFGGLVVLAVLSLAVISPARSQNALLVKQIDEDQYGAARLLEEANTLMQIGSFEKAKKSLDSLYEKHPASTEAADGVVLYTEIDEILRENDRKWNAAVVTVRTAWEQVIADAMRAELEQDRVEMEASLSETLAKEWEESKDEVREEWEKL